jgi:predicted permease
MKEAYRDQRGLPVLDVLGQDTRFAIRLMRRNAGFTVTAVLVLGLGIGVNNMLFTMLNASTLRGLPLPQSSRVLFVSSLDDRGRDRGVSFLDYRDLSASVQRLSPLAAFREAPMILAGDGRAADRLDGVFTTASAFDIAGVKPVAGRLFTSADERPAAAPVMLVSESLWTTRYGRNPAAIGQPVFVDARPAALIGVIPDRSGVPVTATVWRPLSQVQGTDREPRDARTLQVLGRVSADTRIDDAIAEIAGIGDRLAAAHAQTNRNTRLHAVPINNRYLGNPRDTVWIAFMATGFIVLLISAANVANLMVDRSLLRTRELSIRAAVGGTATRLVRQLLVEGVTLAAAGAAVGLLVSMAGVRAFRTLIPADALPYWVDYSLDWRVLAALIGVSGLTVMVFALVPAIQASRTDVVAAIKNGGRPGTPRRRRFVATSFMAAQIALSVVLLAHFAVTLRSDARGFATDTIFDRTDILTATLTLPSGSYATPESRNALYVDLLDRLSGQPGLESAAITTALPASGGESMPFVVESAADPSDGHAERTALVISTTAAYFQSLDLKLLQGRVLGDRDGKSAPTDVVVNQRFAGQAFPGERAIGRRISIRASGTADAPTPRWLTIVGVAPDIRQRRGDDPDPVIYLPLSESAPATASIVVRTALDTSGVVRTLREEVAAIDAGLPIYRARTLRQLRHDLDWNGRASSRLFTFLTFVAVFLATVGLYAVTAHAVTRERQEIGIRIALGAEPRHIVARVLRHLVVRAAIGFGGGILLTMLWDRGLGSGAPGIRATDAGPLAIVAGILSVLMIAAAIVPSRRASRVDPLVALRME